MQPPWTHGDGQLDALLHRHQVGSHRTLQGPAERTVRTPVTHPDHGETRQLDFLTVNIKIVLSFLECV